MSISLNKKTGINLTKGKSIALEKAGRHLHQVCVGLNWGVIESKAFFGLLKSKDAVDLDGSVSAFDSDGQLLYTVYYHKTVSKDRAVRHSGDDLTGDASGDDGRDNEIIQIDLPKVMPEVQTIVFFLNSYKGQDFASIPYSKIRIFEGNNTEVRDVLATFNLSAEAALAGCVAMIMGKLVRRGNGWDFIAIGEGANTQRIDDTITLIQEKYL